MTRATFELLAIFGAGLIFYYVGWPIIQFVQ